MKLHKRYWLVGKAEAEISLSIAKLVQKHDLTIGEVIKILNSILGQYIKYLIRYERHPDDSNKKGDEA